MRENREGVISYSVKTVLLTLIAILLFGIYLSILTYGENSILVLNSLQKQKELLSKTDIRLKVENQRLQKEYFELKQLEPKEQ
jgi:hypothetical protein